MSLHTKKAIQQFSQASRLPIWTEKVPYCPSHMFFSIEVVVLWVHFLL